MKLWTALLAALLAGITAFPAAAQDARWQYREGRWVYYDPGYVPPPPAPPSSAPPSYTPPASTPPSYSPPPYTPPPSTPPAYTPPAYTPSAPPPSYAPPSYPPPRRHCAPPPSARPCAARTEWSYSCNGGGCFRMVRPGHWVEFTVNGRFCFNEVNRTTEYIEMVDPCRKAVVRLYERQMVSRSECCCHWSVGYTGCWR